MKEIYDEIYLIKIKSYLSVDKNGWNEGNV